MGTFVIRANFLPVTKCPNRQRAETSATPFNPPNCWRKHLGLDPNSRMYNFFLFKLLLQWGFQRHTAYITIYFFVRVALPYWALMWERVNETAFEPHAAITTGLGSSLGTHTHIHKHTYTHTYTHQTHTEFSSKISYPFLFFFFSSLFSPFPFPWPSQFILHIHHIYRHVCFNVSAAVTA